MRQFREYEADYGVDIRSGWIKNDVCMTINRRRTLITYSAGLSKPLALRAVTTMIEVLNLQWEGRQFRFRYPLPEDGFETAQATARNRRDFRRPDRLAVRRLLGDSLIELAEREGWELWELAETCGLDEATVRARVNEWREARKPIVRLAVWSSAAELDGSIPF